MRFQCIGVVLVKGAAEAPPNARKNAVRLIVTLCLSALSLALSALPALQRWLRLQAAHLCQLRLFCSLGLQLRAQLQVL